MTIRRVLCNPRSADLMQPIYNGVARRTSFDVQRPAIDLVCRISSRFDLAEPARDALEQQIVPFTAE